MCGVVGGIAGKSLALSAKRVEGMARLLAHRGPDSHGIWEKDGAVLAHRRLAIVDLTSAGHQPMQSHNGRLMISYNGEIYNHLDIRKSLEQAGPISWRGHSDTETLVEALSRWGTEKTLASLNGMFAFASWNMQTRSLTLARDPFGEKPLHYAIKGDAIVFASELSAICALPELNGAIDIAALGNYLQLGTVPVPQTMVTGVNKLPPGMFMEWQAGLEPKITSYWSVTAAAERGLANPISDEMEALDELENLLQDAVNIRLMSDVPLGALLSGGIDSSLVVAMMQKQLNKPVHTFTIGFEDAEFNEAEHAKAVAQHLGARHEMLVLSETEALAAVPRMGAIYDEPFSDASQVPTYLVSALARKQVTVVLTGDGCDEVFSGYARHIMARKSWETISRIPARKWLGPRVSSLPSAILDAAAFALKPMVPAGVNPASLRGKLSQSGAFLSANNAEEIYERYMRVWPQPEKLLLRRAVPVSPWAPPRLKFNSIEEQFMWSDCVGYLHNDILTKVDRASMAVSLETRIPVLDRRVAEFAWRLPQNMRWREGKGKWALREILYRHVPKALVDRPKKGFAVPLQKWLHGPLKGWADDLLSPALLQRQGLFDVAVVQKQYADFQSGRNTTAGQIWTLLMFQSWLEARGQ